VSETDFGTAEQSSLHGRSGDILLRHPDHFAGLPIVEAQVTQLGLGNQQVSSWRVRGEDTLLVRLSFEPRSVGRVVSHPGWLVLFVPLRWRGDFTFNGLTARPNDAFIARADLGYATVGADRDTIAVGLRSSRLVATLTAFAGHPIDVAPLLDRRLGFGEVLGPRLGQRLLRAMAGAAPSSDVDRRSRLGPTAEDDLFSAIADLLLTVCDSHPVRNPVRSSAIEIVRAAERIFEADQTRSPRLADMCAASGVGQTWLHKCFLDIYGCSPGIYFQARRLSLARERLLDPSLPPTAIKQVALSLGFINSGRFAFEYRERFGENPSDTLRAASVGDSRP
jgi:AraC-like DNA-binding protein